jgi:acetyl esterase
MMLPRFLLAAVGAALLFAADEAPQYDMAHYMMGFFRKGPNYGTGDPADRQKLLAGHLANIRKMAALGKLAVAGPFEDHSDMFGVLIFKGTTADEAKALVAEDPMVKSGQFALELHPWFAANGLRVNPPKGFVEENDVEYSRPEGKALTLDLRVPVRKEAVPAVIIVHGGGFARGSKRTYVTPLFDLLSVNGFAWFTIDYRMAPDFELPQTTADVANAIRWVRANAAKYHVDPDKIALAGESAGGFLVAYAGVKAEPDTRVAAVVDFYGPHDLVLQTEQRRAQTEDPAKPAGPGLKEFLGLQSWQQADAIEKLKAASPITCVHAGMPPFLFIHGTADEQVSYQQSPLMCDALKKAAVQCEVITVDGGRHGMGNWDGDAAKAHWKPDMIQWLKKVLGVTESTA